MKYKSKKIFLYFLILVIITSLASINSFAKVKKMARTPSSGKQIKIMVIDGCDEKYRPKTSNGNTTLQWVAKLENTRIKVEGADNVTINGTKASGEEVSIGYSGEDEKTVQIIAQSGEEAPYITYLKLKQSKEIKTEYSPPEVEVTGGKLTDSMPNGITKPDKNGVRWRINAAYFIEIPKGAASDKSHKISLTLKSEESFKTKHALPSFAQEVVKNDKTLIQRVRFSNDDVSLTNKKVTFTLKDVKPIDPIDFINIVKYVPEYEKYSGIRCYTVCGLSIDKVLSNSTVPSVYIYCYEKPENSANKTALVEALDKAPKDGYYKKDDRYNGKKVSKLGFWEDYKKALKAAKRFNDAKFSKQPIVDKATKDLNESIENLIPESRINPTNLYEAIQKWNGKYLDKGDINHYNDAKHWSRATWNAFYTARKNAEEMLSSLYDENGNPTDANKASENTKVEKLIETLEKSGNALKEAPLAGIDEIPSRNYTEGIKLYARLYDPSKLKESDYTPESWKKYKEAYANAMDVLKKYPTYDPNMARENILDDQNDAFLNFRKACYRLSEKKDTISVKLSCIDNCSIRNGNEKPDTVTKTVTLQKGQTSFVDLVEAAELSNAMLIGKTEFFVNGVYLYKKYGSNTDYKLRDGDEVVMAMYKPAMYLHISETWQIKPEDMLQDDIRHQKITTSLKDNTVKAGETFTVNVKAAKASPAFLGASDGVYEPVENSSIYVGEANKDREKAERARIDSDTTSKTDKDGNAEVTLYKEGWTLLYAYDLTKAEGAYNNGSAIMLYVKPTSDLNDIKKKLQKELDDNLNNEKYPEEYFKSEDWDEIKKAYNDATEAVKAAKDGDEAREGQIKGLSLIKKKQKEATKYNKSNLESFRTLLNKLPSPENLDKSTEGKVRQLIKNHDDMTGYQKKQLTDSEEQAYKAIKDAYEKGLPDTKQYSMSVKYDLSEVPEADKQGIKDMIKWLQDNTPMEGKSTGELKCERMASVFSFNKERPNIHGGSIFTPIDKAEGETRVVFCQSLAYAVRMHIRADRNISVNDKKYEDKKYDYKLSHGNWEIEDYQAQGKVADGNDGHMYRVNGNSYVVNDMKLDGLGKNDAKDAYFGFFDFSDYMGKNSGNQFFVHIRDSFKTFEMPYNDVTFTVKFSSVDKNIDEVRQHSLNRLAMLNSSLGDKAKEAYNTGIESINKAATVGEINKAYNNAVVAMRKAADKYGKVKVTVENTTYPKSDGAPWDGKLVDEWVEIDKDSTMMGCIVKALEKNGHVQKGAENNYISSIDDLAEFDGGARSGWMGTLNGWFTNLGFAEFTVKNGKLSDGDIISVMYTTDLGNDLGGSWDNHDTTIKELGIEGGKLLGNFNPGKPGNHYDYYISIDGEKADLKFTPTATNSNFLTKIFLNKRVNSNDEGSEFFKQTQSIGVKSGDTIYIGCGMRAWPSMNNQAGGSQTNEGTWYAFHIVTSDNGYDAVSKSIKELPQSIRYVDYKDYADEVKNTRIAYDGLSESAKAKVKNLEKLKKLEAEINDYETVDKCKALIKELPNANHADKSHKSAIQKAAEKYKALTPNQKAYLNTAEKEKMEALLDFLDTITEKYTISLAETNKIIKGETGDVVIGVANPEETTYNSYYMTVEYDKDKLEYKGINTNANVEDKNGVLTISGKGTDKSTDSDKIILSFKAKSTGDTVITLKDCKVGKNSKEKDATPEAIVPNTNCKITIEDYTVSISEDFEGDKTVSSGSDYTFKAKNPNYEYKITASMGDKTAEVIDNRDGTYTIKNVKGNLVISASKIPKSYKVIVSGSGKDDITAPENAKYGSDYVFTLNQEANFEYIVTVKVNDKLVSPKIDEASKAYTLDGTSITGDIKIDVVKTEKPVIKIDEQKNSDSNIEIVDGKLVYNKQKSTKAVFTILNSNPENLTKVSVDGKALAQDDYTAEKGSIILTLKKTYLDNLAVGNHKLTAETKDGTVETDFIVKDESDADKYTPSAEKVEVDFGRAVTKDMIKGALKGIPDDAMIDLDEASLPDGKTAGAFELNVTITYKDKSQDKLVVKGEVKEEKPKPDPEKPDPKPDPDKPNPQKPDPQKPGKQDDASKGGKTTVDKDNIKAKDTAKTGDNANPLGYAGLAITAIGTLYLAKRRKKTL